MKVLIKLKPFFFLIGFVGILAISIFLWKIWINNVTGPIKPFGILIVLIGFVSYYFFWIYSIGYGFILLDKKNGIVFNERKFLLLILSLIIIFVVRMFFDYYFLMKNSSNIPLYLNVILTLIILYCILSVVIKLTRRFKYYDKKEEPKLFDYIVTFFLICFFPFGLLIMQSHLRLFLKENQLIV